MAVLSGVHTLPRGGGGLRGGWVGSGRNPLVWDLPPPPHGGVHFWDVGGSGILLQPLGRLTPENSQVRLAPEVAPKVPYLYPYHPYQLPTYC